MPLHVEHRHVVVLAHFLDGLTLLLLCQSELHRPTLPSPISHTGSPNGDSRNPKCTLTSAAGKGDVRAGASSNNTHAQPTATVLPSHPFAFRRPTGACTATMRMSIRPCAWCATPHLSVHMLDGLHGCALLKHEDQYSAMLVAKLPARLLPLLVLVEATCCAHAQVSPASHNSRACQHYDVFLGQLGAHVAPPPCNGHRHRIVCSDTPRRQLPRT